MTDIAPDSLSRRSFVYHKLRSLGARFREHAGAAVAVSIGEVAEEAAQARVMALCDLSPLSRCGFKGKGAADWLAGQGLLLPEVNRALRHANGVLIARLGAADFMVLDGLQRGASMARELAAQWEREASEPGARGNPVPRQDSYCWFCASGARAPDMLAKICAVDLRLHRFAPGCIAQTQVAQLNAVVIRADLGTVPAFHLFADSASAGYWWDCMVDAMQEFSGRPVGLDALCELEA